MKLARLTNLKLDNIIWDIQIKRILKPQFEIGIPEAIKFKLGI